MTSFARDHHHDANPWKGAPSWALELREMLILSLRRQETLIEMVRLAGGKLSPEDQKKMDEIFDKATAIKTKIDAALPPM